MAAARRPSLHIGPRLISTLRPSPNITMQSVRSQARRRAADYASSRPSRKTSRAASLVAARMPSPSPAAKLRKISHFQVPLEGERAIKQVRP